MIIVTGGAGFIGSNLIKSLNDQNISNMSVSYNRLRSMANREKIYDDRSFRHLNTSVSICEEEIRKLKKQLTLAVRMFRKRGENLVMEMQ